MDTKDLLAQALAQELEHRPLKDITIQEIVDQAGVIRQTFYYHFKNIYGLAQYLLYRQLNTMLLAGGEDGFRLQELYTSFLAKKTQILHLRQARDPAWWTQELILYTKPLVEKFIRARAQPYNLAPGDLTYLVEFYTYGFVGTLTLWLDRGMPDSYRTNFALADQLFTDSLDQKFQALEALDRDPANKK